MNIRTLESTAFKSDKMEKEPKLEPGPNPVDSLGIQYLCKTPRSWLEYVNVCLRTGQVAEVSATLAAKLEKAHSMSRLPVASQDCNDHNKKLVIG